MVAKPTDPSLNLSDQLGPTLIAFYPMCETLAGTLPLDIVSRKPGRPAQYSQAQNGLGPILKPTGFSAPGFTAGPSLKWGASSPQIQCANTASGGGTSGTTGFQCTQFGIFYINYVNTEHNATTGAPNLITPSNHTWTLTCSEASSSGHGLALKNNNAGAYDLCYLGSSNLEPVGITWNTGVWLGVAAALSSGTNVLMFAYDFTNATLLSGPSGTAYTLVNTGGLGARCSVVDNIFTLNQGISTSFPGEMACAGIDHQLWTPTIFNNWVADPWACARGNTALSNPTTTTTLNVPFAWQACQDDGAMWNVGYPSGGVSGAPYTYQWVSLAAKNSAGSSGTPIAGATTREYKRVVPVGTHEWACCKVSDGTNTVYSNPVNADRLKGNVFLWFVATSLIQKLGVTLSTPAAGYGSGYACPFINSARGGSSAANPSAFQGWDPQNSVPAAQTDWWANELAYAEYASSGTTAQKWLILQHGTNDGAAANTVAGYYGAISRMCASAVALGWKVALYYTPARWDGDTSEANMESQYAILDGVGLDPTNFPTLVRQSIPPATPVPGANVYPMYTHHAARVSMTMPYAVNINNIGGPGDNGLHFTSWGGIQFGYGIWADLKDCALEPLSGTSSPTYIYGE